MAMTRAIVLMLALVAPGVNAGLMTRAEHTANPVRKVVTLLQKMEKQVVAEGEREKDLYEKFVCYCKTGTGDFEASIAAAEAKIESLDSEIKASTAEKAKTEEQLAQAKEDRKDAKAAMAAATAQREKEAAAFAKFQTDTIANIGAIVKAVAALEKGAAGNFLQTSAASALKSIVADLNIAVSDYDRQQVLSFLGGNPFSQGYSAQSGQIVGILKEMGDEMATALADATAAEEKSIHIYNELMAAKTSEVTALTKQIEEKIQKTGELAVSIAEMSNDHEDTVQGLAADQKFLAELQKSCATKADEWAEICKLRNQELAALHETIKILNNDDALELFKKTLPGASSFVQVSVSASSARARALELLQQAALKAPSGNMIGFIEYALKGKKIGFEKVIAMIDEMVLTLKKEQADDDSKKEYCDTELDMSDDKKKSLEKTISDTEASIEVAKETIATLTQEIATLMADIKELDSMVAKATEQRKEENSEFKQLMADDTAAKEVLKLALNRLNKYYNPKMYVAPTKAERSSMDATADAFKLVQISAHKAAPPPPPETFEGYSKKTEEHGGVVQMINLLITDLDKEMAEAETTEKDSQADYEELMRDSADKRAQDSKTLADKESAKAQTEEDLQAHKDSLRQSTRDLGETLKYIHDLHMECDWLLKYFDVRKEMRASEVDALGKAKAVLSGADYSL
jgi:septal ring factor EnvC (AmiA/AmiB activator)